MPRYLKRCNFHTRRGCKHERRRIGPRPAGATGRPHFSSSGGQGARARGDGHGQSHAEDPEELRRALEEAAKSRRVSLNQEIIDRLEYVRDREGLLPEVLKLTYGVELGAYLMLIARVMLCWAPWRREQVARVLHEIRRDPYKPEQYFDDAIKALSFLFQALRPGAPLPENAPGAAELVALDLMRALVDPRERARTLFADDQWRAIR